MHISIIPDDADIANFFPFLRCFGCSAGCTGNYESYHCPICPEERFKPTRKGKLLLHLQCHFTGSKGYVASSGFRITTCRRRCGYEENCPHFHCPFCGKTLSKKPAFECHVSQCKSSSHETRLGKSQSSDFTSSELSGVSLSPSIKASLSGNRLENDNENHETQFPGIIPKHISAIFDGQNVEDVFHIERCRGCKEGCTGDYESYHCPICPSERIKATKKEKLLNHLFLHFYGEKGFVVAKGYRITICHHSTCGDTKNNGHFHCPICTLNFMSRTAVIAHIKNCTSKPRETKPQKISRSKELASAIPAVESKDVVSAFAIGSDDDEWNLYPEGRATKGTGFHISIIRDGQRVEDVFTLKRCRGCDKDCSGDNSSYHCPICPTERFNPATKVKVMSHLHHHFSGSKDYVVTHGYRITTCHNSCGYKRNSRSHFHCPFCLRTVNGKNFFETHVEDCSPPEVEGMAPQDPHLSASGPALMALDDAMPSKSVCQSAPVPEETPVSQSLTIEEENDEQDESQDSHYRVGYFKHISVISEGQNIADCFALEQCQGCDAGCSGGPGCYHCPICPPRKFKPAKKKRVMQHLQRHFTEEKCCIVINGYRITICQANCASSGGNNFRPHLHCPFCGNTFKNRDLFVLHTCKCRTSTPQTSPNSSQVTSDGASSSKSHRKRTIECEECHKEYHPKYIREHIKKIHLEKEWNVYVNNQTPLRQESDESVNTENSSPIPTKASNGQLPLEDLCSPIEKLDEPLTDEKLDEPLTDVSMSEEPLNGTEVCQQESNSALISLILAKLLPISFVEGPEIRDYVRSLNPNYKLPTCETVQSLLHSRQNLLHKRIEELIMLSENLSLTVDLWSNRQKMSYIAITGHMIIDYHLHSVLLGWKCIRGKYSADNIFHYYENILFEYNTDNKINTKIDTVVTNNAPSLLKAFHLPGFKNTRTGEFENCSDVSESESNWFVDGNSNVMEYLPERDCCFSHSLQLVVMDALQKATYSTKAFSKVPAIVGYVRKSTKFSGDQFAHQHAVSTNWIKQLKLIRTVLAIPKEEMLSMDLISGLTTAERQELQEFVDILTLFEEAIGKVQKQNKVTASYVVPVIRGLRYRLSRISPTIVISLKNAVFASLDDHMGALERKMIYHRAAVLDPRYKLNWCRKGEADKLRSFLMSLLPKKAKTSDPSCSPPRKRICLFSFMNDASDTKDGSVEVETYLEEKCLPSSIDPLTYWKSNAHRFPCLARHAQRYLGVPASLTPLESIFSTSGKIVLPNYVTMDDAEFEMLMYNKCNSHLL